MCEIVSNPVMAHSELCYLQNLEMDNGVIQRLLVRWIIVDVFLFIAEDIDPTIGRFRNLVQTHVVQTKVNKCFCWFVSMKKAFLAALIRYMVCFDLVASLVNCKDI